MPLEQEIQAYEERREELERRYNGEFVVFHGNELLGTFPDLDAAAREAIRRYGQGPYLIRKVGEPPISDPIFVTQIR